MIRLLSTLLFVWALLVGPALCMGGMLEHDCPCEGEAQCEHEDACEGDPCETLARPSALDLEGYLDSPALSIPLEWPGGHHDAVVVSLPEGRRVALPPDREQWPYVERNRPLQI